MIFWMWSRLSAFELWRANRLANGADRWVRWAAWAKGRAILAKKDRE